jgi:OmpA-OmpF porin, OOP family
MNKIKKIAAAVALLGCATSGITLAQSSGYAGSSNGEYNPSWYIAPSLNVTDPDNKFGTEKRGEGVGIRFGKPLSPSWDMQFGTTYARARDGDTRYQQNTLGVDALYMFSRSNFRPFVLFGAGAEYDKTNIAGVQHARASPYVNAGLGFQYALGEQWGMQADLRRAYSYIRGNEFTFNRANTNILTLGLTYAFDKVAPPAPMVTATASCTSF